ncbi:MAG: hypothetical protein ING66_09425 [Rhodocyclaceae bacterium]|nr:hypothetical protein [Rhodocyclaceae bacterium]MCA3025348.1 hypothetical protein [Rhodocyclaceae bacterium]MCA3028806.1 hypothetical protein [Rhodocyclaceae bacterium]MCA3032924.1 hypothetical protein [Rhodocyclaceae bacterium]MCA3037365.1 hypothetical protein [Rhodocyclaceae bacterium]
MAKKLTDCQIAVIEMMRPEYMFSSPPAPGSLNVLQSLERRGLVCRNFQRWHLTNEGKAVQKEIDAA